MIWFWACAFVALCFGVGALLGAPFLPVLKRDTEALLDLAEIKKGDTLIDLGSGDGSLLRAAARRGVRGIGYEINPLLYLWSLIVCWPVRSQVSIRLADFWQVTLPPSEAIYVFLIGRYMKKLDQKLSGLERPTKVVSYVFPIPDRTPVRSTRNSYLYQYGKTSSQKS